MDTEQDITRSILLDRHSWLTDAMNEHRDGKSLRAIGKQVGHTAESIRQIFLAMGVETHRTYKFEKMTEAEKFLIIKDYSQAMPRREILKQHGISNYILNKVINERGLFAKRQGRLHPHSKWMVFQYKKGYTVNEIATVLNCHRNSVYNVLKRNGITPNRRPSRGLRAGGNKEELADELQEPQQTQVSKEGDIWLMDAHRLACGDATCPEMIQDLFGGEVAKPDIMVTDPPYGDAQYTGTGGAVINDKRADWAAAYRMIDADVAYIWHAGTQGHIVAQSLIGCGYEVRAQIVWVKDNFEISRGHYNQQHEPCLYVVRKGKKANWVGGRKKGTAWFIKSVTKSGRIGHPTQKPVGAMARPILNHTAIDGLVYDPFSGAGTTLIACEMEGRIFAGCELAPLWVDVAVRRWQAFTGKEAKRQSDGQNFNACEAAA